MTNATNKPARSTNKASNKNKETIVPVVKQEEVVVEKQVEKIEAPVVQTAPVVVQSTSKAQVANAIFKEMFAMSPVPARKDMIARAKNEAKLTDAGAATYLQNFKSKNGLVVKKTEAATA